ncbi:MAG TPA: NAD-dependent epimerase/dehydratase family protein, partial [Gammaproteobacteria bacterium]|nr:NAD-dependent epimerase/dehydratase family protein [Gammaproteobacteria bacterium]
MIFVTGATDFIGQRLVVRLKAQGEKLKVLFRSHHPEYETVVCGLQREVIPDGVLEGGDTVFHLAGYAHDLRDAAELEGLYRKVNVDATVRLAELAVSSGVIRFVFVNSVKAGGGAGIDGAPDGIYGKTKREAELRLLEITRQSSMHVAIVRPALVYGPKVKGNLQLMCTGFEKGWFPPLPETGNRRSMIHVDDLVQSLLLVAE